MSAPQIAAEGLMPPPSEPPTIGTLYKIFFFMGLFSFGGGMTAWFHRETVIMRNWVTNADFVSGYAMSQVMPGVNSTNMAVYLGNRLRGTPGALVCVLGLLSAPFVVVIAVAAAYDYLNSIPGFSLLMAGVGSAAMGLLLRLGISVGQNVKRGIAPYLALAATFFAVGVMRWSIIPVLLVIAPLSIWASWPKKAAATPPEPPADA